MKYKVIRQSPTHERVFVLKDENGDFFNVDIYTDGNLPQFPEGADKTNESWTAWLSTFVGKTLEIEAIVPYEFFSSGKISVVE